MTVQVERQNGHSRGDGFAVISNEEVALSSKGASKLPVRPRRIGIFRDEDAKTIAVIANDAKRAAFDSRNTVTLTLISDFAFADLFTARIPRAIVPRLAPSETLV